MTYENQICRMKIKSMFVGGMGMRCFGKGGTVWYQDADRFSKMMEGYFQSFQFSKQPFWKWESSSEYTSLDKMNIQ